MHEYRVETIETSRPASHADFIFRTVVAALTRLEDQRTFRLKFSRTLGLKAGDVVKLSNDTVKACEIVS